MTAIRLGLTGPNVSGETVSIDLDPAKIAAAAGNAIATSIRADLASRKGKSWNRSGTLAASITSTTTGNDAAVSAGGDRLTRDPELLPKLLDALNPPDPSTLCDAIAKSVVASITITKKITP